ncbi:zygote arrest protein 1 [Crocuta crocuta]
MAPLGDEALEGCMYPACVPYSYPYPYPPAGKGEAGGGGWRHGAGGYAPASSASASSAAAAALPSFPGCGQLTAAEYFDSYQRAQLMAFLAQVGPGLGARRACASSQRLPSPRQVVSSSSRMQGCSLTLVAADCETWAPQSGEGGALVTLSASSCTVRNPDRGHFLEQKYGYYHCKDCNIRWESAYVWCVQGTNKVYFKQFCRTCQKSYNPYRVEDITCQSCKQTRCSCPVKLRHVDPKRPHRQDLCGRCRGKRLSCDSTFSFKYII